MAYWYEKMSFMDGQWFAHLSIATNNSLNALGNFKKEISHCLRLLLENAKGQTRSPDYRIVTSRHQIDRGGNLFVSQEWNVRQQPSSVSSANTGLVGERYATQYDFDKFCFDNPDERLEFDWNAEVYRAFVSATPGVYTPASNNDSP